MIERQITQDIFFSSLYSSRNAFIAEATSTIAESNRKTDIYFYRLRGGILYSSTHNTPVIESTASQRDRELIRQIESWAKQNQQGFAVWVSPPQEKGEVATKITLMRIIPGNVKMIENKSALVNLNQEETEALIAYLLSCSITPAKQLSREEARYQLIILTKKEAVELIEQFFPDSWEGQKARIKRALEISQKINDGEITTARRELEITLGRYPLSCPTIGMATTPKNGLVEPQARYLECTCPFCHNKVRAKIERGKIYCPACGRSADYTC
jgi:hypothetical protein